MGDVICLIFSIWTVYISTFLICLCFLFNGQRMAQFLIKLYIWFYCSSPHFPYLWTANNAIFSVTFLYIILELCFFVFSFTSNNIFVSIMKSLQIPTSKMKCILITAYRYDFDHFLKVTVILNDFTVAKGFREIRNF